MKISQSMALHITEITWVYSACPYQFKLNGLNLCMGSLCECWTYSDFLELSVELFVSVSRHRAVGEERGKEGGVAYQDTILPLL